MEATGVYWKPVYYVLEDGFRVILVNPAEIKRMPGRKTDVSDCAWLAQLLENGMLRPSFIPPREIRELRDLVRYRVSLKHDHTRIANRLHKVLQDADLKLSSVMSDILGVSGRQILSQLAKGNCNPVALADLARANLRGKLPQLRQALSGRFNAHHAFLLSRLLADLDNTEEAMARVAERIAAQLVPFAAELERLCTIPGVKQVAAAAILAEIGTEYQPVSQHRRFGQLGRNGAGQQPKRRQTPPRQSPQGQSLAAHYASGIRQRGRSGTQYRTLGALPSHDSSRRAQACRVRSRPPHFEYRLPFAPRPHYLS